MLPGASSRTHAVSWLASRSASTAARGKFSLAKNRIRVVYGVGSASISVFSRCPAIHGSIYSVACTDPSLSNELSPSDPLAHDALSLRRRLASRLAAFLSASSRARSSMDTTMSGRRLPKRLKESCSMYSGRRSFQGPCLWLSFLRSFFGAPGLVNRALAVIRHEMVFGVRAGKEVGVARIGRRQRPLTLRGEYESTAA